MMMMACHDCHHIDVYVAPSYNVMLSSRVRLKYNPCLLPISYALDTAALLGGNEYLVSEMMEKLSQTVYSRVEKEAIKWGLRELCPGWTGAEMPEFETKGFNQGHLINLFTSQNKERLPSEQLNVCN
jgi:hypothetical protein